MRVLVIGSGGREHAICWAIAKSPLLTQLWCAPGNPGTAQLGQNVAINEMDGDAIVSFASTNDVDLVVIGPEAPLVGGLGSALAAVAIPCFGPSQEAAQLEGSKSFCKVVCDAARVPTAKWRRFDNAADARTYIRRNGAPIVVKADGLAAGKGVVVANSEGEAIAAVNAIMEERIFGTSGNSVVIEEYLVGQEVSLFALCDGFDSILFGAAQDHKPVGEGDTGPNTGGMGAYSPPPCFPLSMQNDAMKSIIRPVLAEMARRGAPFKGVLFAGLMLTANGPKIIEFNVRFGDPECQALLLLLQSDILPILSAVACGGLSFCNPLWYTDISSVAVVMAARGYPTAPMRGGNISGLARAAALPGVNIFHAGTELDGNGVICAHGGRVLTVCATWPTLELARIAAYEAIDGVEWADGFCRRDIGLRGIARRCKLLRTERT